MEGSTYLLQVSLPVHVVSVPLQDPFDWQYLTLEPLKINPSSQLKETLLGNVVSRPVMEPFKGFERLPQSLAENKSRGYVGTCFKNRQFHITTIEHRCLTLLSTDYLYETRSYLHKSYQFDSRFHQFGILSQRGLEG